MARPTYEEIYGEEPLGLRGLWCRTFGHKWRTYPYLGGGWDVVCARCGKEV